MGGSGAARSLVRTIITRAKMRATSRCSRVSHLVILARIQRWNPLIRLYGRAGALVPSLEKQSDLIAPGRLHFVFGSPRTTRRIGFQVFEDTMRSSWAETVRHRVYGMRNVFLGGFGMIFSCDVTRSHKIPAIPGNPRCGT